MNLAAAHVAHADIMDPPGRDELRAAYDCLVQAIALYRLVGNDGVGDAGRAEEERLSVLRRLEP